MDMILLTAPAIGSALIGFYFVFFGIWNACHWQATRDLMQVKKIPFPALSLTIGIILETLAGACLIAGFYTQLAALLLIPFTVLSIFIFHQFWTYEGELRQLNMVIFIVNITVTLGALLLLLR